MRKVTNKDSIISSVSGLTIGFASGLIGVGGGEYRAPVLIYLLNLSVKFAIAANLLIGLFTVSASFLRRVGSDFTLIILTICLIMSVTSIIGSYLGAIATKKLNDVFLKRMLGVILLLAAIKVLFYSPQSSLVEFRLSFLIIFLIGVFGLLIGLLSGFLGVAGGEFRIPVLLLIIGLPIKIAGTANLLISIPTVLVGFIKHKNLGHVDKKSMLISFLMAIFSIIGAIVGASLIFITPEKILLIILSFLMLLVSAKMLIRP